MNDFQIEKVYFQFTLEKLMSSFYFLRRFISIVVLIRIVFFLSSFSYSFTSFVYFHRLWPCLNNCPSAFITYNDGVKNNNTIWQSNKFYFSVARIYIAEKWQTHNAYGLDDNSHIHFDDIQYPILHNNCPNYMSNMVNHCKCSYQHFENVIMNYEKNGKMISVYFSILLIWMMVNLLSKLLWQTSLSFKSNGIIAMRLPEGVAFRFSDANRF